MEGWRSPRARQGLGRQGSARRHLDLVGTLAVQLAVLLALLALLALPLPGELFEGRIQAPAPLKTPLSGEEACVAGVRLWTRSGATAKGSSSTTRPTPRFAEGATLTVDGEALAIVGAEGSPEFADQGESWRWDPGASDDRALEGLRGWGFDSTLDALTDPAIDASYTHVEAHEVFTRCGETLTLRAVRDGASLRLVDTNPTESANALGLFAKLFGGFFLLLVLPLVLLIVAVIRKLR